MSFPRYPEYKNSGVEWLGEVPGHWEIERLKRSTLCAKNGVWGDEAQQDENDIPCVRVADFDRQALRVQLSGPTIRNVIARERVGRVLMQGDLLLEKSGGGEGQPVGCVVLYDDPLPAVCSNFVARVQPAPDMDSSFWRYVHAAAYAVRINTRSIKQTSGIQNLDASQYFDERAGFPPLSEQTQIAAFLDRETAKIDALVAEQRRLMALLKEKRQAVISHAVTRGLNPHAPMKPSGIEWLGDVPKHWKVMPAKRISSVFVPQRNKPDLNADGEGHFWVTMEQMRSEEINSAELSVTESAARDAGTRVLSAGSVIASCVGTFGLAAINNVDVIINQQLQAFIPTDRIDAKFMRHCVVIAEGYFEQIGTAATIAYVNQLGFANMPMVLPPKVEQHQIVEFLAIESAKFDTLTAEAQRAIDLLQERRTALISAAVTGQIDVRGAV
ncbi:MAG: restriction endonuclease subunit S [Polaromonas sp.]|nr:restriction endonuclease subunit S [Polaromonas sp.]